MNIMKHNFYPQMNDHDYAAQLYTVSDSKQNGAQVHDITLSLENKPIINFQLRNNIAQMADNGFDTQDLLDRKSVQLNISPFLGTNDQMTSAEVKLTQSIATVRIHVDRGINKIILFTYLIRLFRFLCLGKLIKFGQSVHC